MDCRLNWFELEMERSLRRQQLILMLCQARFGKFIQNNLKHLTFLSSPWELEFPPKIASQSSPNGFIKTSHRRRRKKKQNNNNNNIVWPINEKQLPRKNNIQFAPYFKTVHQETASKITKTATTITTTPVIMLDAWTQQAICKTFSRWVVNWHESNNFRAPIDRLQREGELTSRAGKRTQWVLQIKWWCLMMFMQIVTLETLLMMADCFDEFFFLYFCWW